VASSAAACETAAIAAIGWPPVPWRARRAEAELENHQVTEQTARRAAKASMEGATPLARNAYKMAIFEAVVRRAIMAAAAQDGVHA